MIRKTPLTSYKSMDEEQLSELYERATAWIGADCADAIAQRIRELQRASKPPKSLGNSRKTSERAEAPVADETTERF